MEKILITYKKEISSIASFVYVPFLTFVFSLGMVYLFGRMLGLVVKDKAKNTLAFFSMIVAYSFYFLRINTVGTLEQKLWMAGIYISISVLFYVLLGFKLYTRVDTLLDKIADDKKKKH